MDIKERINRITALYPSDIGILITDGAGGIILSHNQKIRLRSASVIKLFVFSFYIDNHPYMDEVMEFGSEAYADYSVIKELHLERMTVKELLTAMIASSDNTATNILIQKAGLCTIDSYISNTLNLSATSLRRLMLDYEAAKEGRDNYTTAEDVVAVLQQLYGSDTAMEILSLQKNKNYLMRYIYKGVMFYGKSGELEDVRNDCGILRSQSSLSFAAVLTNNLPHPTAAELCGLCGLLAAGKKQINLLM